MVFTVKLYQLNDGNQYTATIVRGQGGLSDTRYKSKFRNWKQELHRPFITRENVSQTLLESIEWYILAVQNLKLNIFLEISHISTLNIKKIFSNLSDFDGRITPSNAPELMTPTAIFTRVSQFYVRY